MIFHQWVRELFGPASRVTRASRRRRSRAASRHRHVPRLELLEDRLAPAVLMVTNVADSGTGSLRQAILNSFNHINGGTGNDTIQFAAAIDGGTISLTTFVNNAAVAGPTAFWVGNSDTLVIDGQTGLSKGITISRSSAAPAFRLFALIRAAICR